MKKILLLFAATAAVFSSCSKENHEGAQVPDGGLVFEVSTKNALDTRADLYSQEAVHQVERVSIYAFQKTGADYLYLKTFTFDTWIKGTSFQRYDVLPADNVPMGDYKFLAVGRDLTDNYTLPTLVEEITNYNDFTATIGALGTETEIFAGSSDATVSSTGMRVSIEITRKVAGVLGYFKNVPTSIDGTAVQYLRLSISNSDTIVNLTTGTGNTPTGTSFNLIDVDLSGQGQADGVYTGNDLSAKGVVKLDNTQLNGAFVLPVGNISMTLGLYSATNAPLKTWTIKDGVNTLFNITANHFYALGTKTATGNTTGTGDPAIPDAPIDLMTEQEIGVTINPVWSAVHNLTIE